jgi:XTP/dITP diphosphohydrolase
MKLYFVTTNKFKIIEVKDYLNKSGIKAHASIELYVVKHEIQEVLDPDIKVIVYRKAIDAYDYLRRPCVVEHGGIFMEAMPKFPGGVGQVVWDAVEDRMCMFLGKRDSRRATARSVIGYCDGRSVHTYIGETPGQIAQCSRGNYKFNWDPIFIPEGSDQTYGEMGLEKKRATSPVVQAWKQFLEAQFPDQKSLVASMQVEKGVG